MFIVNVPVKIKEEDKDKFVTEAIRRGYNFDSVNSPTVLLKRMFRDLINKELEAMLIK